MYAGHLHILGMVHDCKWIAERFNQVTALKRAGTTFDEKTIITHLQTYVH